MQLDAYYICPYNCLNVRQAHLFSYERRLECVAAHFLTSALGLSLERAFCLELALEAFMSFVSSVLACQREGQRLGYPRHRLGQESFIAAV